MGWWENTNGTRSILGFAIHSRSKEVDSGLEDPTSHLRPQEVHSGSEGKGWGGVGGHERRVNWIGSSVLERDRFNWFLNLPEFSIYKWGREDELENQSVAVIE